MFAANGGELLGVISRIAAAEPAKKRSAYRLALAYE
jgi:hypothetical protein